MPAAVAVPLIVGAGTAATSIAAAKIGSNAANKAADMQERAANRSLSLQRGVYDDQRRLVQPYVEAGGVSLSNLMKQHWGGQGMPYQAQPEPRPMGMGRSPTAGMSLRLGTVRLEAPDGSGVRDVPAHLAEKFIARGARRVS